MNLFTPNGATRLAGGSSPREGRVEIYNGGQWGTVCDDYFTDREASVVCRELGYAGGGTALPQYGGGTGPILMDDVSCSASPTPARLYQCSFRGWGVNNCDHSEVNTSICCAPAIFLISWQVVTNGRVEVYNGVQWGTVCDDEFSDREASVVCRELGYASGGTAVWNWGGGSGPILMDNVVCPSNPTPARLYQCNFNGWGFHDCDHNEVGTRT
ncbi:hypothetical protein VOLCADRAFT_70057 [Volvox carteri f. nagariensis]|uniref:SRCR domain-containing protein n=1 Tax=Volvox carteri f. nagariensis TaxID=3068 RepID=D8UJR5_VOLCA|nr:uncharacterized protein VOLCADRAFT_70057 [Volvox carteri f. nagariensis]EFJ40038.1 hypothetical protein VOLCADRAFT_70057 [Volvox carteri f. nagariensis]|eukprot:XP_002958907.1 hypothetical protein VOLCADRAFT_70057 [Volvox carteri f. nagariensis]